MTNSNNTIQVSSEVQEGLTVVDTDTCANGNSVSYDCEDEILCFNRNTTGWIIGNTNDAGTSWTNSGETINWLKLKRMSTKTPNAVSYTHLTLPTIYSV